MEKSKNENRYIAQYHLHKFKGVQKKCAQEQVHVKRCVLNRRFLMRGRKGINVNKVTFQGSMMTMYHAQGRISQLSSSEKQRKLCWLHPTKCILEWGSN